MKSRGNMISFNISAMARKIDSCETTTEDFATQITQKFGQICTEKINILYSEDTKEWKIRANYNKNISLSMLTKNEINATRVSHSYPYTYVYIKQKKSSENSSQDLVPQHSYVESVVYLKVLILLMILILCLYLQTVNKPERYQTITRLLNLPHNFFKTFYQTIK